MSVTTTPVQLPALLQEQTKAAREAGFYDSEVDLVTDAVRTLLAARPDLRVATARRLYARATICLGKAAELGGMDIVRFNDTLHERGITRMAPESPAETAEMASASLRVYSCRTAPLSAQ